MTPVLSTNVRVKLCPPQDWGMRGLLLKVCNGFREKVAGQGGAERRWTHVAVLR